MIRRFVLLLGVFVLFLSPIVYTQNNQFNSKTEYLHAKVTQIHYENQQGKNIDQSVEIILLDGDNKGSTQTLEYKKETSNINDEKLYAGEEVVVSKSNGDVKDRYEIIEKYRVSSLLPILFVTFLVIVSVGRLKGVRSLLGLGTSIWIILQYTIPSILHNDNTLITILISCIFIAGLSMYLAHGFNKKTSIALISTLISILFAIAVSIWSVNLAKLFGLGSEEAFYLLSLQSGNIDLKGLLLGGIIIGCLGVLDDITIAQTSVVKELYDVNPMLSFKELFHRALNVGQDHVASMVNTLALAYAGASFPLLLIFSINTGKPLWLILNSELVMEEIIRTSVGSIVLVLAVPLSTFLATYIFTYKRNIPL